MAALTGPGARRRASGRADSLVIFLHGYGADGERPDRAGRAAGAASAEHPVPRAERAASAASTIRWATSGFRSPGSTARPRRRRAAGGRAAFAPARRLARRGGARGSPPERTVLFGFSQGTMMALQVGLRRRGGARRHRRLLRPAARPDRLAAEIVARPPVLLVHGDDDPMVPVAHLAEAADALAAAGVETYTHVSRGIGARHRARRPRAGARLHPASVSAIAGLRRVTKLCGRRGMLRRSGKPSRSRGLPANPGEI